MGCPTNAGGAGTHFDVLLRSLHVSNNNKSTQTDTVLLEFPVQRPLWESLIIDSSARVGVPLLWSRIQVSSISNFCSEMHFQMFDGSCI